jgi:hypothetical protein
MNTEPPPKLEYTNCCQPWHGFVQIEVLKEFVLSWSEKALGKPSVSRVTPVTTWGSRLHLPKVMRKLKAYLIQSNME